MQCLWRQLFRQNLSKTQEGLARIFIEIDDGVLTNPILRSPLLVKYSFIPQRIWMIEQRRGDRDKLVPNNSDVDQGNGYDADSSQEEDQEFRL
jgi:hypothetical protein